MKVRLTLLFCMLVLIIGCDVFTAPFRLFQELLPIAIKYAPYALMFLEVPEPLEFVLWLVLHQLHLSPFQTELLSMLRKKQQMFVMQQAPSEVQK